MTETQPKKNGNDYPVLQHHLIQAIRARAPKMGRDGWYSEVADAIGVTDGAVKGWFYGKNLPGVDNQDALKRYFGVEFAHEIEQAATGFHVSEGQDEMKARLERLEAQVDAMKAEFDQGRRPMQVVK